MRFDLTDEQRAIQDSARSLAAKHFDPTRQPAQGDPFWPELAANGFAGIAVGDQHGGQGLGLLECALVVEELGRALAPATFLNNAAAAALLNIAGDDAMQQRWLPGMASGEHRAALAFGDGEVAVTLDAAGASVLLVAGGDTVRIVEGMPDLAVAPGALDLSRTVARADVSDARPLQEDRAAALDQVEVLLSAELVGVAQRALELAVEHATQRQQFGRSIGTYQAVSHRCADVLVAVESARSAVLGAAWTADHEPELLGFAASVAKVTASDAAWEATAAALQIFGGMGFTWEHPIHRFLRRARMTAGLLSSADTHLERLATIAGL